MAKVPDSTSPDVLTLHLPDSSKKFIEEALNEFLDGSHRHGRKVVQIRMTKAMYERMETTEGMSSFRGVPIRIRDTAFDGTVEVVLSPVH